MSGFGTFLPAQVFVYDLTVLVLVFPGRRTSREHSLVSRGPEFLRGMPKSVPSHTILV